MTVSKVYAELKAAGLVEARPGSGTFVAESLVSRPGTREALAPLWAAVDALLDEARDAGLGAGDLLTLLAARIGVARRPALTFVVAGLFPAATESYALRIAAQVGEAASVAALVLGVDFREGDAAALRAADLVITFGTLEGRIAAIAPDVRMVSIRFIPAESTRLALAALDPLARVAVVSRFADFLPVLELGVRRFAPHVRSVVAMDIDAPDLARIAACDVVVMSTGAEAAGALARPGAARIEYRHIPDPGDVERLVMPWVRGPTVPEHASESTRKEAS